MPKFATKQEIANTYMNKYGSEAYMKYQEASKRLAQQQQQQQKQTESIAVNTSSSPGNGHAKQTSLDSNDSLTYTNAKTTVTSPSSSKPSYYDEESPSQSPLTTSQQQQQQSNDNSMTSLPSHLRLEFDKLKYIPDMVKTIKKRHSISEIESSMHTVPPQVFQRILEQHQKNNQQQQPNAKLELIEESDSSSKSEYVNLAGGRDTPSPSCRTSPMASEKSGADQANNESTMAPKRVKPILKQSSADGKHSRHVCFDPHALFLDAAVEGELDLVIKCASQVQSISEPNDEGITALHNSVCAGHFEIVKFLVESGCDINYADNDGWTPLHCAASCNNLQMVRFLIEHGACIFATTISDNETAVDKCEEDEDGFMGCSEYLLGIEDKLGSANNSTVHTLYDYVAQNDDELSFKAFDQLAILAKDNETNDGWWKAESNGKVGYVPRNYLGVFIIDFYSSFHLKKKILKGF
jgi:hypothetical protein